MSKAKRKSSALGAPAKAANWTINRPFDRQVRFYETGVRLGAVRRPKGAPKDAFVLKIAGDCLAPRAVDGQMVVVERALPRPGDLAVFWFKEQVPVVKILLTKIWHYPAHPESECFQIVEAEQLNPPKRYSVSLDKVECIARVHSVLPRGVVVSP